MKNKKEKNGISAEHVFRLSPREIFEDLLGEPAERGYNEETLKELYDKTRYFACDRRFSEPEIEDGGKERMGEPEEKGQSKPT